MAKERTTKKKKSSRSDGEDSRTASVPKKRVQFVFEAPDAREVSVTGSFCDWTDFYPMKRDAKGRWKRQISLASGRHEYRFLVDGEWRSDPRNDDQSQNPFGETNSVLHA